MDENFDLDHPHNRADEPSVWAQETGERIGKWLVYSAAASLSIMALSGALWVAVHVVRSLW
jgi:hypothetical protein